MPSCAFPAAKASTAGTPPTIHCPCTPRCELRPGRPALTVPLGRRAAGSLEHASHAPHCAFIQKVQAERAIAPGAVHAPTVVTDAPEASSGTSAPTHERVAAGSGDGGDTGDPLDGMRAACQRDSGITVEAYLRQQYERQVVLLQRNCEERIEGFVQAAQRKRATLAALVP